MENSMQELKDKILQHAQSEWMKDEDENKRIIKAKIIKDQLKRREDENKRIIEAKKIERAQRDLEIKKKEIAIENKRRGDSNQNQLI